VIEKLRTGDPFDVPTAYVIQGSVRKRYLHQVNKCKAKHVPPQNQPTLEEKFAREKHLALEVAYIKHPRSRTSSLYPRKVCADKGNASSSAVKTTGKVCPRTRSQSPPYTYQDWWAACKVAHNNDETFNITKYYRKDVPATPSVIDVAVASDNASSESPQISLLEIPQAVDFNQIETPCTDFGLKPKQVFPIFDDTMSMSMAFEGPKVIQECFPVDACIEGNNATKEIKMEDVNELNEQMAEKLQIGVYEEKAGWQFESNSKNVGLESKCHTHG